MLIKGTDVLEVLGKNLKKARKKLKYTQEYVAEGVDISIDLLRNIENGRNIGSVPTLLNLCNFFQKYLPGQKHLIGGYVYEIRNIVETDLGINAILENSTTYDNNTYRQDRDIKLTSEFKPETSKTNHYTYIICKYYMGTVSYEVETKGYYEFMGGISCNPGNSRDVELDEDDKEKIKRKHKNADAIKIEIDRIKSKKVLQGNAVQENQIIGSKIALLISEVLYSMLGENYDFIQVNP